MDLEPQNIPKKTKAPDVWANAQPPQSREYAESTGGGTSTKDKQTASMDGYLSKKTQGKDLGLTIGGSVEDAPAGSKNNFISQKDPAWSKWKQKALGAANVLLSGATGVDLSGEPKAETTYRKAPNQRVVPKGGEDSKVPLNVGTAIPQYQASIAPVQGVGYSEGAETFIAPGSKVHFVEPRSGPRKLGSKKQ
jgi:hypothetical protein